MPETKINLFPRTMARKVIDAYADLDGLTDADCRDMGIEGSCADLQSAFEGDGYITAYERADLIEKGYKGAFVNKLYGVCGERAMLERVENLHEIAATKSETVKHVTRGHGSTVITLDEDHHYEERLTAVRELARMGFLDFSDGYVRSLIEMLNDPHLHQPHVVIATAELIAELGPMIPRSAQGDLSPYLINMRHCDVPEVSRAATRALRSILLN